MASYTPEINGLYSLLLVLAILPLITSNSVDCNGKAFNCVNSTHFRICVDFGRGLSSTVDDFVIPCPLHTECRVTNRFECEYPPTPLTTTTAPTTVHMVDLTKTVQQATNLKESKNVEYKTTVSPHTEKNDGTLRESSFIEESATSERVIYEVPITKESLEKVGEKNLKSSLNNINIETDSKRSTMSDIDLFVITDGADTIISTTTDTINTDSVTQEHETKILRDKSPYGTELTSVVSVQASKTQNPLFDDMVTERLSSGTIDPTTDAGVYSNNMLSTPSSELNLNTESRNKIQINTKATSSKISSVVGSTTENNTDTMKYDVFDNGSKNNATTKSIISTSNDNFVEVNNDATTEYHTTIFDNQDVYEMSSNLPSTDSTFVDILEPSTFLMNDLESVFTTELVTTQDIKMSVLYNLPEMRESASTSYTTDIQDTLYNKEIQTFQDIISKNDSQMNDLVTENIIHISNTPNGIVKDPLKTIPGKFQQNVGKSQGSVHTTQHNEVITNVKESKSNSNNYFHNKEIRTTEIVNVPTSNNSEMSEQDLKTTEDIVIAPTIYLDHSSNSLPGRLNLPISDINFTKNNQDDRPYHVFLPTVTSELETITDFYDQVEFDMTSYNISSSRASENLTLAQPVQFTPKLQVNGADIIENQTELPVTISDETNTVITTNVVANIDKIYTSAIVPDLGNSSSFDNISKVYTFSTQSKTNFIPTSSPETTIQELTTDSLMQKNEFTLNTGTESIKIFEKDTYNEIKYDKILNSKHPALLVSTTTAQTKLQDIIHDYTIIFDSVSSDNKSLYHETTTEILANVEKHVDKNYTKDIMQSNSHTSSDLENVLITTTLASNPNVQINQVSHMDPDHSNVEYDENNIYKEVLSVQSEKSNIESYDQDNVSDSILHNAIVAREDFITAAQTTVSTVIDYSKYENMELLTRYEKTTLKTFKDDINIAETLNHEIITTTQSSIQKDIGASEYDSVTNIENILTTTSVTEDPTEQVAYTHVPLITDKSITDYDRSLEYDQNNIYKDTLTIQSTESNVPHSVPHNTLSAIEDNTITAQITTEDETNVVVIYDGTVLLDQNTLTTIKNDVNVSEPLNNKMVITTQTDVDKYISTGSTKYVYITKSQSEQSMDLDLQNLLATTTATSNPRIQRNQISSVSVPVPTDESLIDYYRNIEYAEKHIYKETLTVHSEEANGKTNNENNVPGNEFYISPVIQKDFTTTQVSIESTINDLPQYYDVTPAEKYESTTLMPPKSNNDVFESLNHEIVSTMQSDLEKAVGTSTVEYSYNTRLQSVHNTAFDLENVLNSTMATNERVQIDRVSYILDAANKDESTINYGPNLGSNEDFIHKEVFKMPSEKGDTKFHDVNQMSAYKLQNTLLPIDDSTESAQIITERTINYYDSDLTAVYEVTTSTTINNYDFMTLSHEMVMTTPSNEDMGTNPAEYLDTTTLELRLLQTGQNTAFDIENVLTSTPVYDSSVYDLRVEREKVADIQASNKTDENSFEHDRSLVFGENYIHKETFAIQLDEASSRSNDENEVLYNVLNDKLLANEDSTTVQTTTEGTINDYSKYYHTDLPVKYEITTVRTKDDKAVYETTNHKIAMTTRMNVDKKIGTILNNELVMSTQSNADTEVGITWTYLPSPKMEIEENTDVQLENINASTSNTADAVVEIKQLVPIHNHNNTDNYIIKFNNNLGYDKNYTNKEVHTILSKTVDSKSNDENKVLDNVIPKSFFVDTTKDYSKHYHTDQPANYESTTLTIIKNAVLDLSNNETTTTYQSNVGKDVDTKSTENHHSKIKNELPTTLGFENIIIPTPDSNDVSVQIKEVYITNPITTIEISTEYNSHFGNIESYNQEENRVKVINRKKYNESLFSNILDKPFLSKEDSAIEVQSATRSTIMSSANNEPTSSTTNYIDTDTVMTDSRSLNHEMAINTQPYAYISVNKSSTNKVFQSKSSLQTHIYDAQNVGNKDSSFQTIGDHLYNEDNTTTGDIMTFNKNISQTNLKKNGNDDLVLGINENKYSSGNIFYDKVDTNIGYGEISHTIKTLTVSEMVLGTSLNNGVNALTNKEIMAEPNNENQHHHHDHHHHSLPNVENITSKMNAKYDTSQKDTTTLLPKPKNKLATQVNSSQTEYVDNNQPIKNSYQIQNNNSNYHNDQNIELNFHCLHRYRGRYADTENCRKFYICIGKHYPIIGICPINSVFSEIRKQCTRNLSHCVRNHTFHCTAEGRFNDIFHNNIYYICVKNSDLKFIRYKLQCQNGYHLNKHRVHCVPNVVNSSSRMDSDDSHRNSDTSETDSSESRKEYNRVHDFNCEKDGKFPDPNNCRKYYVCYKNKLNFRKKLKSCDSDEVFDKDKEKCIDAESNEC